MQYGKIIMSYKYETCTFKVVGFFHLRTEAERAWQLSPLWFHLYMYYANISKWSPEHLSVAPFQQRSAVSITLSPIPVCCQVYSLMRQCWTYSFEERPCFSSLGDEIESIIQEERDRTWEAEGEPWAGWELQNHTVPFVVRRFGLQRPQLFKHTVVNNIYSHYSPVCWKWKAQCSRQGKACINCIHEFKRNKNIL